jgi:acetyl-CoA synthetase
MSSPPRLDAYHFYEQEWDSYEQLCESFEWEIPEAFNIAEYVCDRWASDRGRVALFAEDAAGNEEAVTFWQLQNDANRLANHLAEQGIGRGDRIGVNVNQRPAAMITHIAAWKLGAVSVPLSLLFGPDALRYRLGDCDASACVVEDVNLDSLREIKPELDMETVLTIGNVDHEDDEEDFWTALEGRSRERETVTTDAEDDAVIIYTSGTTGPPKGVLHAHRFLLGHLPVVAEAFLETGDTDDNLFWTPVEWSWVGSLFSVVVPAHYYGLPVVAYAGGQFDPEKAYDLIDTYGITYVTGPPTAMRMMSQVEDPDERWDLSTVRRVGAGGEAVGESITRWAEEVFDGAPVEEAYGQTEANLLVSDCSDLTEIKRGTIGPAAPGHELAILDPETQEPLEPGEAGEIAVRYEGDPVCFVEYWEEPEKTATKVHDGWLLTEDLGKTDEDGYVEFVGRTDDVIISAGYRIGPEEIEEVLATHDAVADAGVIGVPHDERGEVPKAFVVPAPGHDGSERLEETLRDHVRDRLADYEYPREFEFLEELPRTSTEKVRRRTLREREGLID